MKKLIEDTIQIYKDYGKLNTADYKQIVDYLNEKGYILVDGEIITPEFINYVFEVGKYYLDEEII